MSLLFETICINDGIPLHLSWHEERMNRARAEIWNENIPLTLKSLISVPGELKDGIVRCNIGYGPGVDQVNFRRYDKNPVRSLQLVACNFIDYHVKYSDRALLKSLLDQRGNCDEIIIVKNGFITDTSMSNLVFHRRHRWFTPSTPLLAGTCRQRLLARGEISEVQIRPADLHLYSGVKLINAMRNPGDELVIPMCRIYM
jgi:4-amino-4-deoxychorismate lyase